MRFFVFLENRLYPRVLDIGAIGDIRGIGALGGKGSIGDIEGKGGIGYIEGKGGIGYIEGKGGIGDIAGKRGKGDYEDLRKRHQSFALTLTWCPAVCVTESNDTSPSPSSAALQCMSRKVSVLHPSTLLRLNF